MDQLGRTGKGLDHKEEHLSIERKSFIDRSADQLEVCGRSRIVANSGTSQSFEARRPSVVA